MNKCLGCGVILQNSNKEDIGYVTNLENKYCERCFRIKNYGDYKIVSKDNTSYIEILKEINKTSDLVILVVDIKELDNNILMFKKYLNNDMILVLTKRDTLPLSINDEKIKEYAHKLTNTFKEIAIISSKKNIGLDDLFLKIKKYKKTNNVYLVGYTNAGKSSLINKIVYNYYNLNQTITTSILPSTTLDTIEIKLDDLTIIDTPGLIEDGNIINYLDGNDLKNIIPDKEIKPITYQIKTKQYIYIDKYLKIESSLNDLTLYFSSKLKIERLYKDKPTNLKEIVLDVENNQDIVILGLGFIKVKQKEKIKLYILDGISVKLRDSLI